MTLAVLCSGQGGQHAAMFALLEGDLASASDAAGFDLRSLDARDLFANDIAQPLICAAQGLLWEALAPRLPEPALVAGYSVGEVAAHVCAGAVTTVDAIGLARERARLMSTAGRPGDGLVAVRGLDLATVRALGDVAIVNGEDQIIVGGRDAALVAALAAAEARGAVAQRLPVGIAAHTPLLAAAVDRFRASLERVTWTAHARPVIAGIDASPVRDRARAIATLSSQVATTIRWDRCMDAIAEYGTTVCLELGPGQALARLMRDRHPAIESRSVAEFRSLEAVVRWVEARA